MDGVLKSRSDVIVCGAGSSGSVVARRLAENADVDVLLLEAGGTDRVPSVTDAAQWPANLGGNATGPLSPSLTLTCMGAEFPCRWARCWAVGRASICAAREVMPGNLSHDALEVYLRNGVNTYWHESGTAKMGRDAMSVVDGRLKLYGIENVRIADASIIPRITSGNTMAPCVVIGERAAQFIRNEHGL